MKSSVWLLLHQNLHSSVVAVAVVDDDDYRKVDIVDFEIDFPRMGNNVEEDG